jgi:hypothetical protein
VFPPRINIVPVSRHRRCSPRCAGTVCLGRAGRAELRIPSLEVPPEYRLAEVLAQAEVFSGQGESGSVSGWKCYASGMPRFLKRIVLVALVTTFFVALLAGVCTELSYAQNTPSNPQPQIGKVVRMTVNHGSVIYATHEEWVHYRYVQAASGFAMLLSFIGLGTFKLCSKNAWN